MTTPDAEIRELRDAIRRSQRDAWNRLGELFRQQRGTLSRRYADNRRLFVRERGIPRGLNEKFIYDLEHGPDWGRRGFGAEKILKAADAYSVTAASVTAALDGGQLVTAEPHAADAKAAEKWLQGFVGRLSDTSGRQGIRERRAEISAAVARNLITPRMADEMSELADADEAEVAVRQMEAAAREPSRLNGRPPGTAPLPLAQPPAVPPESVAMAFARLDPDVTARTPAFATEILVRRGDWRTAWAAANPGTDVADVPEPPGADLFGPGHDADSWDLHAADFDDVRELVWLVARVQARRAVLRERESGTG